MTSDHNHVIPVILCEAKLSASNIIDPHDSLNIPMKHNVFGMRHAKLVGKRVHIQTLISGTIHVFYAIYFLKLKSPFLSNSKDLSALCPVESVNGTGWVGLKFISVCHAIYFTAESTASGIAPVIS